MQTEMTGWTCGRCGAFIRGGSTHECWGQSYDYPPLPGIPDPTGRQHLGCYPDSWTQEMIDAERASLLPPRRDNLLGFHTQDGERYHPSPIDQNERLIQAIDRLTVAIERLEATQAIPRGTIGEG